jgi:hypothetical protein
MGKYRQRLALPCVFQAGQRLLARGWLRRNNTAVSEGPAETPCRSARPRCRAFPPMLRADPGKRWMSWISSSSTRLGIAPILGRCAAGRRIGLVLLGRCEDGECHVTSTWSSWSISARSTSMPSAPQDRQPFGDAVAVGFVGELFRSRADCPDYWYCGCARMCCACARQRHPPPQEVAGGPHGGGRDSGPRGRPRSPPPSSGCRSGPLALLP